MPEPGACSLPFACRWILSRLSNAVAATIAGLETYDFAGATQVGRQLQQPLSSPGHLVTVLFTTVILYILLPIFMGLHPLQLAKLVLSSVGALCMVAVRFVRRIHRACETACAR